MVNPQAFGVVMGKRVKLKGRSIRLTARLARVSRLAFTTRVTQRHDLVAFILTLRFCHTCL
mgnify:CR=1 FL=1